MQNNSLKNKTKSFLELSGKKYLYYSLPKLEEEIKVEIKKLPFSIRVLLENMLHHQDEKIVTEKDVLNVLNWQPVNVDKKEIPYKPSRVVMQDFTGVPAVVDLAAMREKVNSLGKDPKLINPLVETALVIDHSVQVDFFGNKQAFKKNIDLEYKRNKERYSLLKWAQKSFENFKVVPPGVGIIHQVNLEYLAKVVQQKEEDGNMILYPDTLIGTDSHTTMINGIGVMGWGVGGIEAEAVILGQAYYMLLPDVIGVRLVGSLQEGVTSTDLVLTITEKLRAKGVVGKFVEFFGSGLEFLQVTDRATIANMAPEYGATMGFFPVDKETIAYLKLTGRSENLRVLVEKYYKSQNLFRESQSVDPEYSDVLEVDLEMIKPSLAGPKRPQDRVLLDEMESNFKKDLEGLPSNRGFGILKEDLLKEIPIKVMDQVTLKHGSVVLAAITSCTNTSNPSVMIGAALIAKKATEKGLNVKPYVKTSLAPGSQVVTEYLQQAGLLKYLEMLKFHIVGYGCTTCIGNSGSLSQNVIDVIEKENLVVASVLSGNRNFEGRINPHIRANYLASPLLVVAYALVGTVLFDPKKDSLGTDNEGNPVYLKDIWPSKKEIEKVVSTMVSSNLFLKCYQKALKGDSFWNNLQVFENNLYQWEKKSTYIQCPPFFEEERENQKKDVIEARVLAMFSDSVTTDHISPAGAISSEYPAGRYLIEKGIKVKDFNSYGSRRGNHEVMMRGTFANIRIKNQLLKNKEGGITPYFPEDKEIHIYDASEKYQKTKTPLIIIAGKEYGTGSSRDWAAKGTKLLKVKAVIAESYERIHRNNLVGMGVLPLQFKEDQNVKSLDLDGSEIYSIKGIASIKPASFIQVTCQKKSEKKISFDVLVRLDTQIELNYYANGGILQTVLKEKYLV